MHSLPSASGALSFSSTYSPCNENVLELENQDADYVKIFLVASIAPSRCHETCSTLAR